MNTMDLAKALPLGTIKTEPLSASPIKSEEKSTSNETLLTTTKTPTSGKIKSNLDEKFKLESDSFGELLGSVTTQNCPGVRASARVIQKMKQDSIRPSTPPPNEKELKAKEEKGIQKTPSQTKTTTKATWTNIERNYFFDALNEFGKEFDAIGNYINSKLKRKSATDAAFKTRDQVRQHFYQTFHKLSKYIRFSDEVKKPVQELYTLINYGEMRRKLQFITDKHFMKLKHLVYNGHITIRSKGKNIRIKIPNCKALRRLNQLDVTDNLEDIKLPSKVEVIVSPANMESFGRVQTLAQNPKAKATVSLQKKLVNFIKTFQYKWRSNEMRLAEEEPKLFPSNSTSDTEVVTNAFQDSNMCFRPKPGVAIHRPLLNITEYISSLSLSLSSYEDRIGVKVRSESLFQERLMSNKRQRCDSNSDKRSPESKKPKTSDHLAESGFTLIKEDPSAHQGNDNDNNSNNDGNLSDEINEMLSFTEIKCDTILDTPLDNENKTLEENHNSHQIENGNSNNGHLKDQSPQGASESKGKSAKRRRGEQKKNENNFKPMINEGVIKKIRKGWTIANADDITIGDLYVVFGQDSKLEFEYFWTKPGAGKKNILNQKQNGMPYSLNDCKEPQLINSLTKSSLGNKLKHLLLIANLSERIRKKQCSCGHTCDIKLKPRLDREIVTKSFVSSKTFQLSTVDSGVFRQPVVPFRRPTFSLDPLKQMPNGSRLKMSKQVLVQRMLLPHKSGQAYDVVDVKNLQNKLVNRQETHSVTNGNSPTSTTAPDVSSMPSLTSTDEEQQLEIMERDEPTNSITPDSCVETCHSLPSTNDQSSNDSTTFLSEKPSESIEFDECSTSSIFKGISPLSPMQLLRDSTSNSRWLEENLNDFSLNSLLGHLDEINGNRDITDQSSNLSVLSESSVDYMTKFAEITASMQNEEKDL